MPCAQPINTGSAVAKNSATPHSGYTFKNDRGDHGTEALMGHACIFVSDGITRPIFAVSKVSVLVSLSKARGLGL